MAGFPAQILCPGPNLRYTAVNRAFKPETFHESGQRSVLIILNFDFNQTMELLEKVGAALQTFKNVKIYIKAHPMSRMKELEEFLLNIRFPKYEWASGTVQQWLARVHAVFMTGGSVSNLETIVTGIPLLRVSLGSNFDFDPLWDEYPFSPLLSEPEEIADYLDKAFRMNLSARMKLLEFGRQIANSYFEPVTAETIKVFLN
jgi:predicted AlkP superfamily pyrophosphatase or phosphodiesterase